MFRYLPILLGLLLSLPALSNEFALKGFNERFSLHRDSSGRVNVIRLKKIVTQFTVAPFLEQIKKDLMDEQEHFRSLSFADKESEVDGFLMDLGYSFDPLLKEEGERELQKIRESLLNLPEVKVSEVFSKLDGKGFWKEFERRLKEALLLTDPTVLTHLGDSRYFFKRNVSYKVVEWALKEAQKRFSSLPVLNIASFVIVRVHNMMLEQRMFHHSMLLHYFEVIPVTELGMTKEEVDQAISSIYEYRIVGSNILESNKAAKDWLNYGINHFYMMVRSGNAKMKSWKISPTLKFKDIKKLNFAFAEVQEEGVRKIYHLHHEMHQFSQKPSLAYDYSSPKKVKRLRALLNLSGIGLGFIQMPAWLKQNVLNFIESAYVQQVRTEGALVGYFESEGSPFMVDEIYRQRANFYILK